jgi:O-antigen ligase
MRHLERFYSGSVDLLWAILLVVLPVTSMPAVRELLHINTIASPSVLFLGILLAVWLLPYLARNGAIPVEALPLLGFMLVCLLSIAASFYKVIPSFKDAGLIAPSLSAFITLLVGVGYFLMTFSRISDRKEYRRALMWIYAGGLVMIIWSMMQSGAWVFFKRYPDWMRDFQDLLSLGPLYRQRAAGFALEPSWLAHMLNMLYLPMWLSAAITGYSVFSFRILKKITVEMILLAFGVLTLILTLSRVGWITFFCMAAFLVIQWNVRLIRWIQKRFQVPENRRILSTLSTTLALLVLYIGLIIGAAYGMSRVDPRMSDLFTPQFWQLNNLNRYANALQFGERVVYWQAGWEVFNQHPLLGVGLGNSGRWFAETIPSYGMNLIEVRQLLYRSMDLPNSKNLWVRLLAETGIIGFAFYSAWLTSVLKRAITLNKTGSNIIKMAGYWGIFTFIGIIFEGFSIDSFAMPYFWISSGFVLAACKITRTTENSQVMLEEK